MNLFKRVAIILSIVSIIGCNQYKNNIDGTDSLENSLYQTEETIEIETTVMLNEAIEQEIKEIETTVQIENYTENTEEVIEETIQNFEIEEINKIMYAKSYVNVRNYPSAMGAKVGGLKLAQPVRVLGLTSLGWYLVEYNGENCYVSGNLMIIQ